MSKFLVETHYTCTFKIVHELDELNEKALSEVDSRKDGKVEIVNVTVNNRKTKRSDGKRTVKSDLENIELTNAFVNEDLTNDNLLLAGGEGLVEGPVGGFSETTAASFSVDAALVSVDGDTSTENVVFEYQFNIGLTTSFTGEDSLDIAIDSGSDSAGTADNPLAFDTGAALSVDGVTYCDSH